MAISDIVFGLKLDDGDFKGKLDSNRKSLQDLDNVGFKKTRAGAKQATDQLAAMEKQARKNVGLIGTLDKLAGKLSFAGVGLSAAGGAASLGGMLLKKLASTPAGKPPPIPGTAAAAKQASRMAMAGRLASVGSRLSTAGIAVGAVGSIIALVPALANIGKNSNAANTGIQNLTGSVGRYATTAGGAERSTGLFSRALGGVAGLAAGAVAGVATLGAGMVAAATSGLGMNSSLEQSRAQFEVFTKSASKADAIIEALKKRADITPFETKEYIEGGSALMSAAEGSQEKLMELMKTAEMLTVLNPAEGLTGAALAIKNALAGDFVSLQDRFNISPKTIKQYKDMGLQGQALIRAVLKSMNINEQSVARMGQTFKGRMSTAMSFIDNIRMSLSSGLFAFLSDKLAGAVAWIDANQQWVMDTARGIGIMIGDVVTSVGERVSSVIGQVWEFGQTLWAFFGGLPAQIAAGWKSGALMADLMDLMGSVMNLVWNTLKFLGNTAWNALINGVPMLVAIVGKMVIDGLRDALGERISGMLGLDELSAEMDNVVGKTSALGKDMFSADLGNFMAEQKGVLADMATQGGKIGEGLGWGEAKDKAAAMGGPGLFNAGGVLDKARQVGAAERAGKEAQAAQAAAVPNMANLTPGGLQVYREMQARQAQKTQKIQLISQQPMSAAALH